MNLSPKTPPAPGSLTSLTSPVLALLPALLLAACSPERQPEVPRLTTLAGCPNWNAGLTYGAGNYVSGTDSFYSANRQTKGEDPATHNGPSGEGQSWSKADACGSTPNPGLVSGHVYGLRVTTPGFTNRYVRHQGSLGFTAPVSDTSDTLTKLDAQWKALPGLADPSCFSFQSVNYPDRYLRHQNSRVRIDPDNGTELFRQDATWCVKTALDGSSGNFSLQAKFFPQNYLRHRGSEVWAEAGDGGALFKQDATWTPILR